jgi:hypothetical protein
MFASNMPAPIQITFLAVPTSMPLPLPATMLPLPVVLLKSATALAVLSKSVELWKSAAVANRPVVIGGTIVKERLNIGWPL